MIVAGEAKAISRVPGSMVPDGGVKSGHRCSPPLITGKTTAFSASEEYRSRWGARASKPREIPINQRRFWQTTTLSPNRYQWVTSDLANQTLAA
jgi:hypothetical protein